jgi:predicted RNase H-like nuclease (RuvC/YqgF family)
MYLYEKYKKWKNAEEQEYEKIIVAKANQITRSDEQLTRQDESKKKLEFEIDMLKIKKKTLHEDLDDDDANENQVEESDDQETQDDQQIDFLKMNIIELKDIAKNRGHKRYSKLSKASLIKLLNN